MTVTGRTAASVAVAALLLLGCTDGASTPPRASATASPTPVTTIEPSGPGPSPTEDDTATPSPTDEPSPEPSPTETATATPGTLDPQAALDAAAARRTSREQCAGGGGLADEFHEVLDDRGDALIVFVACFIGAYQPNGELLAYDGQLREWPVEQWQDGRVVESSEVVGEVFLAPDGALENLEQYRALGDCGLFQRWRVDGERLVLEEAREQQCDGSPPAPVDEWPLVHGG